MATVVYQRPNQLAGQFGSGLQTGLTFAQRQAELENRRNQQRIVNNQGLASSVLQGLSGNTGQNIQRSTVVDPFQRQGPAQTSFQGNINQAAGAQNDILTQKFINHQARVEASKTVGTPFESTAEQIAQSPEFKQRIAGSLKGGINRAVSRDKDFQGFIKNEFGGDAGTFRAGLGEFRRQQGVFKEAGKIQRDVNKFESEPLNQVDVQSLRTKGDAVKHISDGFSREIDKAESDYRGKKISLSEANKRITRARRNLRIGLNSSDKFFGDKIGTADSTFGEIKDFRIAQKGRGKTDRLEVQVDGVAKDSLAVPRGTQPGDPAYDRAVNRYMRKFGIRERDRLQIGSTKQTLEKPGARQKSGIAQTEQQRLNDIIVSNIEAKVKEGESLTRAEKQELTRQGYAVESFEEPGFLFGTNTRERLKRNTDASNVAPANTGTRKSNELDFLFK